jgi:hypothetical protein
MCNSSQPLWSLLINQPTNSKASVQDLVSLLLPLDAPATGNLLSSTKNKDDPPCPVKSMKVLDGKW